MPVLLVDANERGLLVDPRHLARLGFNRAHALAIWLRKFLTASERFLIFAACLVAALDRVLQLADVKRQLL